MLNADMIIEKGIKPEDLYCVRTSDDNDEFDFKGTEWAIYEQKDDTRVGGLTIPEFHGKIIEPIAIWLCCDKSYAIYKPTKDMEFAEIRKVNVLVMNTCPLTSSDMIALKDAICKRFNNDSHLVDVITTLDRYMEIHSPMHFDYFVFMNNWGDTQCKRMASLFKTEHSDGRITYSDIDRCRCETVVGHSYYYSKEGKEIIDKLFPITMPYFSKDRYIFLVDEIEPEPGELIGTAYLKLLKNGSQVEDFKPIYILHDEEVDKETWMREKEAHNDNN